MKRWCRQKDDTACFPKWKDCSMNKLGFSFLRQGGVLMKRAGFVILLVLLFALMVACGTDHNTDTKKLIETELSSSLSETEQSESDSESPKQESEIGKKEDKPMRIQIAVGDTILTATPENNLSADAFLALLQERSVTVEMSDYAGMEKVGSLGTSLTRSDSQISVGAGDVILYQGNQITIYYGTNSWNFTKLAHIDGATKENLLEVLGTGDVKVIFSLPQ